MTCRELVELVTDYLEGALPPREARRFEAHVAGCAGCHEYLEQMRKTIRLVGQLTPDDIAPEPREVLLSAFRDWHARSGR
jgi:anti-sigma factor RsiW